MKKIVRITESDINRLVSKIIVEQNVSSEQKAEISKFEVRGSKEIQGLKSIPA